MNAERKSEMQIELAQRMNELSPYLFAELDRKKQEAQSRGVDVISFTVGDPDLPTPQEIVAAGREALADADNHHYPAYAGSQRFRQAAADWMKRRFAVELDPDEEILALMGTKEGIAHLPFVLVGPGDVALCPEPGYPVYAVATRLAGGEVHAMPLLSEKGFLPDFSAIPPGVLERARMIWINYPNNPTAAVADRKFLEQAVAFARQHGLVLCADCAYSEIAYDGLEVDSVLSIPGAREVALEFHSMSKTYNMTGWRIGFVAGRRDVIAALGDLKSNLDSGVFGAVQDTAVAAMQSWPATLAPLIETYRERRDLLVEGLRGLGFEVRRPQATFYVWLPVPGGDDVAFAHNLIEQAGVLLTPGSGFGPSGAGYVRLTLTTARERIIEALERLGGIDLGTRA